MLLSGPTARRAVAAAISAGALAGALFAAAPSAFAQPLPPPPPPPGMPVPAPAPPNCTAADLAGVSAGVAASTSAYLFTHPDVNVFFTSLKGQPKSENKDDVMAYLDTRPQVRAELTNIRQPLVDLRNRCQAPAPQ